MGKLSLKLEPEQNQVIADSDLFHGALELLAEESVGPRDAGRVRQAAFRIPHVLIADFLSNFLECGYRALSRRRGATRRMTITGSEFVVVLRSAVDTIQFELAGDRKHRPSRDSVTIARIGLTLRMSKREFAQTLVATAKSLLAWVVGQPGMSVEDTFWGGHVLRFMKLIEGVPVTGADRVTPR